MSAEHWERVQQLFERALAIPESDRTKRVREWCGDDDGLAREIADLLAAHDASGDSPSLPTVWLHTLAEPEPSRFSPGAMAAGRYQIRALIGRGGMGEVYEAWDTALSIEVALKTLRVDTTSEASHRLLRMEGLLARSVWHPSVCRVYDLGKHEDSRGATWFLTMERLKGDTLAARLRDPRWMNPARAQRLAVQMASALEAAHAAGVVHRDFKPGNVMLIERGGEEQAVVTDFGIARPTVEGDRDLAPEDGVGWGTPAYMAPEQFLGEPGGTAADLYAFGVVLYEMSTGAVPFGLTLEEAKRKLHEPPRSPRALAPELQPLWERVILRCLERSEEDRFRSAAQVTAALGAGDDACLEGDAIALTSGSVVGLPFERDSFLGRTDEMAAIDRAASEGARLLTLVGAAGMGKTRLAIHYGRARRGAWSGGVWFCDLKNCRDTTAVASVVARSLGLSLGRQDPVRQVGQAIAGRGRCLMILDNFDPVVASAAATVGEWMLQAPEAAFLATSREHLRIPSEHTLSVGPLSPEPAWDLFRSRACWLNPGLQFDRMRETAAREIVDLVDGMPLAIELAASRIRVMDVAQIRDGVRDRFRLLTGGSTTRHETLEVAISGSWELLTERERSLCAQCSVFEDGFTLEAAEHVLDGSAWPDAPSVADVLSTLVDRSLVRLDAASGSTHSRFDMYASMKEYARNRLGTDQDVLQVEARHGAWYARLGSDEAIDALDRAGGVERRKSLEREISNVIRASLRARGRGDLEVAVATYRAAIEVLSLRGPLEPGYELGVSLLENAKLSGTRRAQVLHALSRIERVAGRKEAARKHAAEAYDLARAGSDRSRVAMLTGWLGNLDYDDGATDSARKLYEEALTEHLELQDHGLAGVVQSHLGILDYMQGHYESAATRYENALELLRRAGDRRREGYVHGYLGTLHRNRGRFERALEEHRGALAIHRELGDRNFECQALGNLGNLYVELKRSVDARRSYESAVAMARELGDRRNEGLFLSNLGSLHLREGRLDEARTCFETALGYHRQVGTRAQEGYALGLLATLSHREGRLADARRELDEAEAIMREVHFDLEIAKLLCLRGRLELDSSNTKAARSALSEVETMAKSRGWGEQGELGEMIVGLRAACRV